MGFNEAIFYANLPENLLKAEDLLSKYITAFGVAADDVAEKTKEYEKALAQEIESLHKQGMQIGIIPKVAAGHIADKKEELLKSEGCKKMLENRIQSMKERMYNMRHLSKDLSDYKKVT